MLMTPSFGKADALLPANSITAKVSFLHPGQSPGCWALAASKAPAWPAVFPNSPHLTL